MDHLQEVMGSDNDTCVPNPVLAVQELESPSTAKTTLSNGRSGGDGTGPSSPSSRRHQEQVQNLMDTSEVMDMPMRPEDNLINESKALIKQEPDTTSVASIRPDHANVTPSDKSGGGNGSGVLCPRSLTQEEQVKNLKTNIKRVMRGIFGSKYFRERWACIKGDPWFVEVVVKLRVDPCLENSKVEMEGAPFRFWNVRLLHMAVLIEDLEMVYKILESQLVPKDLYIDSKCEIDFCIFWAFGLAVMCGNNEIVDALLEKNAKANDALCWAVTYARARRMESHIKIIQSLVHKGIDINAKNWDGHSAFYLAVEREKTNIVKMLLKWKDKINLNEAPKGKRPPIQVANEEGFKDIESALMQCEDVRRYIDEAFRDRQAYVDAANAILVGAALIASVTFASWLQPPLNYTTSYHDSSMKYVDVEHNSALGSFWVFNTLSFYFAIGTVVFGAHSVLPRRQLFITETVKKLSQNLLLTSILLAFSVLFVIVAFGIAGFIVLIPILRYRWYMIGPTILGGLVCVGSIGHLFKSLWENRPWNIRNRKRYASKSNVTIDNDSDSDDDDESSDST